MTTVGTYYKSNGVKVKLYMIELYRSKPITHNFNIETPKNKRIIGYDMVTKILLTANMVLSKTSDKDEYTIITLTNFDLEP